jgi:hypothetical protein
MANFRSAWPLLVAGAVSFSQMLSVEGPPGRQR